jgi:aspartate/methionine/tyrosine aminotransferase
MKYRRMPIEIESPEQAGYGNIRFNLTESSMSDMPVRDLGADFDALVLAYGDHAGRPELREALAADGEGLGAGDVLVTPGAAAALFIVATSLLEKGSHMIVAHPNYSTNVETPRAIGCEVDLLDLRFEEGFRVNMDRLEELVRPGETKLISFTCPHNPTGTVLGPEELRRLIAIAEKAGCRLLLDETYREMTFGEPLPLAASLSPCAISVASLSKSYGMPGVRIGWIITTDGDLQELFLAAKEQIFLCGSVVDEALADRLMRRREQFLPAMRRKIGTAFGILKEWISRQPELEWVEPRGGVVCFPRIKEDSGVDADLFYKTLNERYGTFVGPGHWFGMDRRFMRIGFGWPSPEDLRAGLENISRALEDAKQQGAPRPMSVRG